LIPASPTINYPIPVRRRKRRWLSFNISSIDRLPKLNPWISVFLIAIFGSQLLLIPEQLFPFRMYIRVLYFVSSLVMIFLVRGKTKLLPITGISIFILLIYCLELFHPSGDSPIAAIAQILLNFAVISPILWIPRLKMDTEQFKYALLCIWLFHSGSAGLGVLEVTVPSRFMRESKIAEEKGTLAMAVVELADGTKVYRPMGFTDTPGGAAFSGYIAVLMSSCFLLMRFPWYAQVCFMVSIAGGLFAIYISHVRSTLVLATLCQSMLFLVLTMRGHLLRGVKLLTIFLGVGAFATIMAFSLGGNKVLDRVMSLFASTPDQVYYSNRGYFIDYTLQELIPQYPVGAGLGKWGQVHQYFGGFGGLKQEALHVEVQLTAWVFDGGVPLAAAYYGAILMCIKYAFDMSFHRNRTIADLSMLVLTLNTAVFANTFSYVPFIGQTGTFFWLMNGCLMALTLTDHAVNRAKRRKASRRRWELFYLGSRRR
jgi:hypothetical protein